MGHVGESSQLIATGWGGGGVEKPGKLFMLKFKIYEARTYAVSVNYVRSHTNRTIFEHCIVLLTRL